MMAPSLKKIFSRNRSTNSTELSKYFCIVEFLDNTDPVKIIYQANTKGQFLLDYVFNFLDLVEKEYFGLRFVNSQNQQCWLDATKLIQLQLKDVVKPALFFRVRFYPPDPLLVKEEITRYFLFLNVRKDLERGRLVPSDIILLTAYIMQEEFGDYQEGMNNSDYKDAMPNSAIDIDSVIREHKILKGMNQSTAESLFLQHAALLSSYGMDPIPVTNSENVKGYITFNHNGLRIFKDEEIISSLTWQQIHKLSFEGHNFIIQLEETSPKTKFGFKKNAKRTLVYKCLSTEAAKHLWKQAVAKNYFFTLKSSDDAPKLVTSGGKLRRSSKFRYSGLCLNEMARATPQRDEPTFSRNTSKSGFTDPYGSSKTGSLPRSTATTTSNDFVVRLSIKTETRSKPEEDPSSGVAGAGVALLSTPVNQDQQSVRQKAWQSGDFNATIDSGVSIESSLMAGSINNTSKYNSLDSRQSDFSQFNDTLREGKRREEPLSVVCETITTSEQHTPVNSSNKMALLDPQIYSLLKDLQTDYKKTDNADSDQKVTDEKRFSREQRDASYDALKAKRISRFGPQKKCLTENDRPLSSLEKEEELETLLPDNQLSSRTRSPFKETLAHEDALNYNYKASQIVTDNSQQKPDVSFRKKKKVPTATLR